MAEHATHSIPISAFDSYTENFADWIVLFEDAVVLATNAPEDRKSDSWVSSKVSISRPMEKMGLKSLNFQTFEIIKSLKIETFETFFWTKTVFFLKSQS